MIPYPPKPRYIETSEKTTLRLNVCSICHELHALRHWPQGVYHCMEYTAYESRLGETVHPSCLVYLIDEVAEATEIDMTPLKRLFGIDEYVKLMNQNEFERTLWIHKSSIAGRKGLAEIKAKESEA